MSIVMSNSPLPAIFKEIEKQSDFLFFYDSEEIKNTKNISIHKPNSSIFQILEEISDKTDLKYSVKKRHIVIYKQHEGITGTKAEKKVAGIIVDGNGAPLTGVNIFVKGAYIGTVSDSEGRFSISVSNNDVLRFSFLGFASQEKKVGNDLVFYIEMQENSIVLDNVVVTALGIRRAEKALSYNVQQIGQDAVNLVKDVNFINSLSGKVAGLDIKSVSAGVGASTRVIMRGVKSIAQNNNVLYVIDGIPLTNYASGDLSDEFSSESGSESISDINPDDIESISVLNGASAAALYGSHAANGAILINTKKGHTGRIQLHFSNQTNTYKPFVLPEFQNSYGNAVGAFESWGNKLSTKSPYEPSDFFDTGTTIRNTLSMSTGNDNNQTYASLANVRSEGLIPNSMYRRENATFRNTTALLGNKMQLDFGFSYIHQKDRNMIAQGEYFNPLTAVYTFPRGEDFTPVRAFEHFSDARNIYIQFWPYGDQGLDMQNPYWLAYRNLFEHNKHRYMINTALSYNVSERINLTGRARIDNAYTHHTRKMYATSNALHAGGEKTETSKGYFGSLHTNEEQAYMDFLINFNEVFGDYSLHTNIGVSLEDSRYRNEGISGTLDLANAFYIYAIKNRDEYHLIPSNTTWRQQTQSLFANAEIGWKSLVYLTLTGRNDWSSTLSGMPNKSFFYPSAGFSGIISDMTELPSCVSYLKLRVSWADVGNGIPRQISESFYKYAPNEQTYKLNDYMPITRLYPERTRSWETGLDARFFDNILKVDFSLYRSNTFNQTLCVPVSASTGYKSKYIQTGDVRNQGIELRIGVHPHWEHFQWNSVFTASRNWNKIMDLGHDIQEDGKVIYYDNFNQMSSGSAQIRLTKGGTMGDLYTTTALATNPDNTIKVGENNQLYTVSKLEKAGSILPNWKLGFGNAFGWKGFNLNVLVSARMGGQVLSRTQAILDYFGVSKASADLRDAGGININNRQIPAETWYKTIGGKQGIYHYYIYDADNVRLQELSLGYRLPASWFHNLLNVQVALVGTNLLMLYNKAPFDPETTSSINNYYQGIDYFMQPSMRTFGFSVKADFN
jgi:TonB-linked SusC/RagA family outer membrane protein